MSSIEIAALHDSVLLLYEKIGRIADQNETLKNHITQLESAVQKQLAEMDSAIRSLGQIHKPVAPAATHENVGAISLSPVSYAVTVQAVQPPPLVPPVTVQLFNGKLVVRNSSAETRSYIEDGREIFFPPPSKLGRPRKSKLSPNSKLTSPSKKPRPIAIRREEPVASRPIPQGQFPRAHSQAVVAPKGPLMSTCGPGVDIVMTMACENIDHDYGQSATSDAACEASLSADIPVALDSDMDPVQDVAGIRILLGHNPQHILSRVSESLLVAIGGSHLKQVWKSVEAYDVRSNTWIILESLNKARTAAGAAVLGECLYAIAGENVSCELRRKSKINAKLFRSVERYDGATNRWSEEVPALPFKRSSFGTAVLNNCIYIIGGSDGEVVTKTMIRYDPQLNYWTPLNNMSCRRKRAVALSFNGHIYVLGGNDGSAKGGILDLMEKYDPKSNQWECLPPLTTARDNFCGCVFDGCLYVVGGIGDGDQYLASCERFDLHSGNWKPVTSLLTPRAGAGIHVYGNSIIVVGGRDGQHGEIALPTIEIYDPQTNSWQYGASMKSPRFMCCVGLIPSYTTVACL